MTILPAYIVRLSLPFVLIILLSGVILPSTAYAGQMYLEYSGELVSGYSFFRGAFDLGDINRDGADEMVIADDEGGFHVYRFTRGGFVPIWISDPLVEDGYMVAVEIIHDRMPGIRPQILLLDSLGTLHQVQYTGYLFEETAKYENYRLPGESGRLVVTDIGGGQRTVLIALPASNRDSSGTQKPSSGGADFQQWAGMVLYKLTSDGLVELTEEEVSELQEGEVYFVQDLTKLDVSELEEIGAEAGKLYAGTGGEADRVGIADLDQDALLELLISVSDPNRPIDRLQIFRQDGGTFTVQITLELPLINEMVLGDIDGDDFSEIVGLTYDGEVLVYQYDPLTVRLADGTEVAWETPHMEIDGTIWVGLGGFETLGCTMVEEADSLQVSHSGHAVTLDREGKLLRCGDQILLPDVPDAALESTPYLPLLSVLDCLGFRYTYDPRQNLVELEP